MLLPQLPSRAFLMAKVEKTGVDSLTASEARRLKKLVTLDDIRESNTNSALSE